MNSKGILSVSFFLSSALVFIEMLLCTLCAGSHFELTLAYLRSICTTLLLDCTAFILVGVGSAYAWGRPDGLNLVMSHPGSGVASSVDSCGTMGSGVGVAPWTHKSTSNRQVRATYHLSSAPPYPGESCQSCPKWQVCGL